MKIWLKIFLVLMVSHRVQSQTRLVVNTTCLELAKPSNQQFRLTCRQYDYHCLLDETFTKEFEVCREWKWIPGGHCAYFNTYGHGNIDERECKPGISLTCSESKQQFESYKSTQFTACYEKREGVTSISTFTSTFQVTPSQTFRGEVETPSLTSKIWFGLPVVLGIIFPFLSLCVIFSIFMRLKATKRGAKDCENASSISQSNTPERDSEVSAGKDKERNDDKKEKEPLLKNSQTERQKIEGAKDCEKAGSNSQSNAPERDSEVLAAYPMESQESSDGVRNEDTVEQQPFLRNEVENTSESPPIMRHEDENITEAGRNDEGNVENQPVLSIKLEGTSTSESSPTMRHEDGNIAEARRSGNFDANYPTDMNESDSSEHFEDAPSSPTIIEQRNSEVSTDKDQKGDNSKLRTNEVDTDTCKSAEVDISKNIKEGVSTADVQRKKLDEEKSENTSGLCIVSDKSGKEDRDTQELTDVFDDTVESLQRIAHPTDENDRELCTELFNLLHREGLKLSQEVLAAIITRETGKSVKKLRDQGKNKLTEVLSEEHRRILESEKECDTSFHVSYGLHQIFLDKEQSPKSGWGNPIRERDTGIGDDVERLNRIQTIVCEISNPVTVSVESYIRLLDIMIESLTRLYPGAKFKGDYYLLSYKLKSIKNPNLTQAMLKKVTDIVKKIW